MGLIKDWSFQDKNGYKTDKLNITELQKFKRFKIMEDKKPTLTVKNKSHRY